MTLELVAALIFIGFLAGCLFCWPLAYRSGVLWAERHGNIDLDDEEWWQL